MKGSLNIDIISGLCKPLTCHLHFGMVANFGTHMYVLKRLSLISCYNESQSSQPSIFYIVFTSVIRGEQTVVSFSSESLQEYDRPVVKTPIPGPRSKVHDMLQK